MLANLSHIDGNFAFDSLQLRGLRLDGPTLVVPVLVCSERGWGEPKLTLTLQVWAALFFKV